MIAIIQARQNSKRFKNKVMQLVNDKPIIWYVHNSVKKSKLIKKIVVAISDKRSDNALANYLKKSKINFTRGDLSNVAQRMYNTAKKIKAKFFLRVSGDSPLIDHTIIDRGVRLYKKNPKFDLITNIFPRTYPSGHSVEIIKTESLKKILNLNLENIYYEHVTKYFYEMNKKFKIKNFKSNQKFTQKKYSIDTPKDLKILYNLISNSQ